MTLVHFNDLIFVDFALFLVLYNLLHFGYYTNFVSRVFANYSIYTASTVLSFMQGELNLAAESSPREALGYY